MHYMSYNNTPKIQIQIQTHAQPQVQHKTQAQAQRQAQVQAHWMTDASWRVLTYSHNQ